MNQFDVIKRYNKDRDKAVLSLDVETFKKFCKKWGNPIPPTDRVIEITMRKMACHIPSLPSDFRSEAKKWLEDRGYTDKLE
jgi:hypothetical protein